MTFPFLLRWSTNGSASLERYVGDSRELQRSFEIVTFEARYAGAICEVDLVPMESRPSEPLLVRFLIGHPTASRITVYRDAGTYLVKIPGFPGVSGEVLVVGGTGTAWAGPETLMVPEDSVFELVNSICSGNRLPSHVELVEQPLI